MTKKLKPISWRRRAFQLTLFPLAIASPMVLIWLTVIGCAQYYHYNTSLIIVISASGLAFSSLGVMIVFFQPGNTVGWLCLWAGVGLPLMVSTNIYVSCGVAGHLTAPGLAYAALLLYIFTSFVLLPIFALLPMLYPNGRFISRRWRWLTLFSITLMMVNSAAMAVLPDFSRSNGFDVFFPITNPIGVTNLPMWWYSFFRNSSSILLSALSLAGIVAIVLRLRQSTGDERQQMKWLAYFMATAVSVQLIFFELPGELLYPEIFDSIWYSLIIFAVFLGFPLVIGLAIFKYRLYDIDRIINRTLVYGGLTLLITAVYVLLVSGVGTLAANQSGQVIGLVLATVLVGIRIRPLHRSFQTTVDRFAPVPTPPTSSSIISQPNNLNKRLNISTDAQIQTRILQVIWLVITLYAFGLILASLPHYWSLRVPQDLIEADITSAMFRQDFSQLTIEITQGIKILTLIPCLVFFACGIFIFRKRAHDWVAIVVSLLLITMGASFTISLSYLPVTTSAWQAPAGILEAILYTCILIFLLAFPDGRFVPRWSRWIVLAWAIYAVLWPFWPVLNPQQSASVIPIIIQATMLMLGIAAQVYRARYHTTSLQRQQIKWVLFGFAATTFGLLWVFGPQMFVSEAMRADLLASPFMWVNVAIALIFPLFIPITLMLSVLRYRLWDVDVWLNRTLVYGGLTLIIIVIYAVTVGLLSQFFQTTGNLTISLIATGLIAVAFQPVRDRLQFSVNRLMFGQRDDPYAVLSHLSQTLQTTAVPTETLTSIVETIAATLKLPYVAIELVEQGEKIGQAATGEPIGEMVELPLRYQKETVGRLLVSPRSPNEKFTVKEEKLLADIAAQTGPVASATRLTLALQRSREKLVMTREEERRRIRRDLHDGLGPTLASQTLQLDTVLELLIDNDPETAGQHVKRLKAQTQQMVADIRRLVYELRPPALDELGLLEALRAHVPQMDGLSGRLHITIEAVPEPLPMLPAAIEVAAYRITLEAITNVIRHADAKNCSISFTLTEDATLPRLIIAVTDDGQGLPNKFQAGVGLISMRERAEELGGYCEVTSIGQEGTQVIAMLPFSVNGGIK